MPYMEHTRGYRTTDTWDANSKWRCDFGTHCLDFWCLRFPDGVLRGGPACKRTREQYHEKYRLDSRKGDVETKRRVRRALRQDLKVFGLCESCQAAVLSPDSHSFHATPRGQRLAARRMYAGARGFDAFKEFFDRAKEAFCVDQRGAGGDQLCLADKPTTRPEDLKSRLCAPVTLCGTASSMQALLNINAATSSAAGSTDFSTESHYLACRHNGTLRGGISANDAEGLYLYSSSGDFAEWHERRVPDEELQEGHVVGFHEGKVGLSTADSRLLGVVSSRPIVLGNAPASREKLAGGVAVAYCGRVPVRVRGPVCSGDLLVASGHDDGFARVKQASRDADGSGCDLQCDLGVLSNTLRGSGQPFTVVGVAMQTNLSCAELTVEARFPAQPAPACAHYARAQSAAKAVDCRECLKLPGSAAPPRVTPRPDREAKRRRSGSSWLSRGTCCAMCVMSLPQASIVPPSMTKEVVQGLHGAFAPPGLHGLFMVDLWFVQWFVYGLFARPAAGQSNGYRTARLLQRSLIAIVLLVVGCVLTATAGTDPVTMRISTHAMIQLDALPHNEHIP